MIEEKKVGHLPKHIIIKSTNKQTNTTHKTYTHSFTTHAMIRIFVLMSTVSRIHLLFAENGFCKNRSHEYLKENENTIIVWVITYTYTITHLNLTHKHIPVSLFVNTFHRISLFFYFQLPIDSLICIFTAIFLALYIISKYCLCFLCVYFSVFSLSLSYSISISFLYICEFHTANYFNAFRLE